MAGISPLALSSSRAGPPLARPTRLATKPAAAPTLAKLLLTAAGGDCWLSVRVGSRAGQVLYEGLLREGSSLRFARTRLWIRVGAPWNLNARLDGKPLEELPRHTGNVLVTRAGVHLL